MAHHGLANGAVVADRGQTSWQEVDGVFVDVDSGSFSLTVEEVSPLLVSHSRTSEGDDFEVVKLPCGPDVDETEASQASSQTDSGDDQSGSMHVFLQVVDHVLPDFLPHIVVDLLNLASCGGIVVLVLSGNKSTWRG